MSEDELDDIRKEKLEELKKKQQDQEELQKQKEKQEAQKKKMLKQVLTPKARERLSNLRVARPQFVESIEKQLILIAQKGQVNGKIDDDQLKTILKKAQGSGNEFNIKRR
ncbi:MAG: DNA-binding TFAR19-related protein PDSD5 family [Candidatus Methanohalarchaeum thermophilum]|uniref:DNA-binding protein BTN85_1708 n=1 Tax=Methanohalarchaeum thermophilum TaxID=1903181 RepID=A0A1Q6DXX0_METT1|nr:MAG: DNA-binding TFAR19-related protein PDSD5 family [Candidatus Methanohalarchaeum thermophilum]